MLTCLLGTSALTFDQPGGQGLCWEVDMEGLEDWEALGVVPGSLPSS